MSIEEHELLTDRVAELDLGIEEMEQQIIGITDDTEACRLSIEIMVAQSELEELETMLQTN